MTAPRRWLRLDVTWSSSAWLVPLRPGGRLAWVELLAYVKGSGISGQVKALDPRAAGRRWGIPQRDVQAMLEAAQSDGALRVTDGDWSVTKWYEYQEVDVTAASRMRRHRAKTGAERMRDHRAKTRASSPLRRNARNVRRNPSRDKDVDVDIDIDIDSELQDRKPRARVTPWRFCPDDWHPNEKHAALAAKLHVDLPALEEEFRDHEFARPKTDPDRAFSSWLRKAPQYANGNGAVRGKPALADDRIRQNALAMQAKLDSRRSSDE